jgi:hypothetical protein
MQSQAIDTKDNGYQKEQPNSDSTEQSARTTQYLDLDLNIVKLERDELILAELVKEREEERKEEKEKKNNLKGTEKVIPTSTHHRAYLDYNWRELPEMSKEISDFIDNFDSSAESVHMKANRKKGHFHIIQPHGIPVSNILPDQNVYVSLTTIKVCLYICLCLYIYIICVYLSAHLGVNQSTGSSSVRHFHCKSLDKRHCRPHPDISNIIR